MVGKAYCPTIHTVTKGLSLSAFFLPFFSFSHFPSLFLRFPTFHLRIFHSSSISTNDPSTTACHIQTSRYVLSYIPTITVYTDCPTDMLTTSDSILQFLNPHIPKYKTCFEILVKKLLGGTLNWFFFLDSCTWNFVLFSNPYILVHVALPKRPLN